MNMGEQILIAMFGASAVYLTQQGNDALRKYAPLLGLCGQPFWFYATYQAEQWGIFVLCFLYTYAWCTGIWNYWIMPLPELPQEGE